MSSSTRNVPATLLLIAGFVCTDVSHMNNQAWSSRQCVSSGSKRTGSTFRGVFKYCERVRPRIAMLENATAID
eukprot:9644570-Prorocentrum_lima.AAC.1